MSVTKITLKIGLSWAHGLLFFDSMKCPYYQKHIKQITFNHTTLLNLTLPIFEVFILISLDVNLSMNQTLLMFLFYKSQTWITPLSLCERLSCMYGFAVMWRRDFLFRRTYLQNTQGFFGFYFFQLTSLHLLSYFFSFISIIFFFCMVFGVISSIVDEILSINLN